MLLDCIQDHHLDLCQRLHSIPAIQKERCQCRQTIRLQRRLLQLILLKTSYLFVFLVVPVVFFQIAPWLVLTGFLFDANDRRPDTSVVFQLAHSVEGNHTPLPDELNTIHNSWAVHQMETTVNFSQNSRFITWYVGGLNYQIEHHLFPKICHIHYPKISAIVRDTAAQFNVPYLENKNLSEALRSHIRLLRSLGQRPTWGKRTGLTGQFDLTSPIKALFILH